MVVCVISCHLDEHVVAVFTSMNRLSAQNGITVFSCVNCASDKVFTFKTTYSLSVVFGFGFNPVKALFKSVSCILSLNQFRLVEFS